MLLIILIKLNTNLTLPKQHPSLKLVIMSGMLTNVTFSLKGYTSNWNRELFKSNEVLKTQPSTLNKRYRW